MKNKRKTIKNRIPTAKLNLNKFYREAPTHEFELLAPLFYLPSVPATRVQRYQGRETMLWTIFVILFILWLIGVVSSYTLGGFIHLLLILAVVALVVQLITGRQPL